MKTALIATWKAGSGGLRWIDDLAARGPATELVGTGYPLTCLVRAAEAKTFIVDPPDIKDEIIFDEDGMPDHYDGVPTINQEVFDALEPDEWLRVTAEDLS